MTLGDLAQVGCSNELVDAIDSDFVKIATTGVSILFSSGDSGSGLTFPPIPCDPDHYVNGTQWNVSLPFIFFLFFVTFVHIH